MPGTCSALLLAFDGGQGERGGGSKIRMEEDTDLPMLVFGLGCTVERGVRQGGGGGALWQKWGKAKLERKGRIPSDRKIG